MEKSGRQSPSAVAERSEQADRSVTAAVFVSSLMHPLPLLLSPLFLSHLVTAVSFPLRGYSRDTHTLNLSKRNNLTGVSIKNANDILYGVNITLGGTSFGVVLDTGRHGGSLINKNS